MRRSRGIDRSKNKQAPGQGDREPAWLTRLNRRQPVGGHQASRLCLPLLTDHPLSRRPPWKQSAGKCGSPAGSSPSRHVNATHVEIIRMLHGQFQGKSAPTAGAFASAHCRISLAAYARFQCNFHLHCSRPMSRRLTAVLLVSASLVGFFVAQREASCAASGPTPTGKKSQNWLN